MDLVIVESPAKAKTINKYLGSDYRVLASYGHVRDLPPRDGSVEPDADFRMHWEVSPDRAKQLRAIADEAKAANRVILATDPDREGEAISWHLYEFLAAKKALPKGGAQRVTFNEITKPAVTAAMKAPRALDTDLVDAYLARRALDYLVGFTLSPVLWRKLPGAKSAGRVQSVALRLIVDREREIEAFRTREYWTVDADLASQAGHPFAARLVEWRGRKLDRFDLADAVTAEAARADVAGAAYTVSAVETKPATRNPYPPFTTSTLQQEAARKLGFTASHTMRVAQSLYEDGLITYMRTDGVALAAEAVSAARDVVMELYGPDYVPAQPRQYSAKAKNAQEAHEAIRPTNLGAKAPPGLMGDHRRLYELVWKRTLASQMASARLERTAVTLAADDGRTSLRATGQVVLFPGFLALYQEDRDEPATGAGADADEDGRRLPRLSQGERPAVKGARAEQHFTEPPPRYSEASLVKKLEELGIGRPSTYASILQTLRDRAYVRVEKNRFMPEESGRLVTAFLERFFERYVSYDFTAGLEERLDDISGARAAYLDVLRDFWRDFQPKTAEVMEARPSDITAALDQFLAPYLFPERADGGDPRACPACGNGRLALRGGRNGAFVACSNYPACRYTRNFASGDGPGGVEGPRELGLDPASQEPVTLKSGRFGPFVQRGPDERPDGTKPPRASLPKGLSPDDVDLDLACKLLSLPRTIGPHPETGKPITAAIGRYGPYLAHDGKYANLGNWTDVFETGMNMAVARLAEPKRQARGAPEPLRVLGARPDGVEVKLMAGRYGPYVTDGMVNATLPKAADPAALTLDEAMALLAARAEVAPAGKRKPAARPKAGATAAAARLKTGATAAAARPKAGATAKAAAKPPATKSSPRKPARKAPAKG